MERELYRRLYEIAYHLGKTRRTKHVVFPDHKIVMTYLCAVLHDRPTWQYRLWPQPITELGTYIESCPPMVSSQAYTVPNATGN